MPAIDGAHVHVGRRPKAEGTNPRAVVGGGAAALAMGICLTPKVAPLGLTVPSALLVAERG